jgi:hypothetical protein
MVIFPRSFLEKIPRQSRAIFRPNPIDKWFHYELVIFPGKGKKRGGYLFQTS